MRPSRAGAYGDLMSVTALVVVVAVWSSIWALFAWLARVERHRIQADLARQVAERGSYDSLAV